MVSTRSRSKRSLLNLDAQANISLNSNSRVDSLLIPDDLLTPDASDPSSLWVRGSDHLLVGSKGSSRLSCSRGSSRPSSVCSGDSVAGSSHSSSTTNPFRSSRTSVQKSFLNTPRYEPYVPRSRRKKQDLEAKAGKETHTLAVGSPSTSDAICVGEKGDTWLRTTGREVSDSFLTTDSSVASDTSTSHQKESEDPTELLHQLPITTGITSSNTKQVSSVSIDLLKGLLSEELTDDLLLCDGGEDRTDTTQQETIAPTCSISVAPTSAMTSSKSLLDLDALAVEQSLKDLYSLFSD